MKGVPFSMEVHVFERTTCTFSFKNGISKGKGLHAGPSRRHFQWKTMVKYKIKFNISIEDHGKVQNKI